MRKKINLAIFMLLLVGIVDQIEDDIARIEYTKGKKTFYTNVRISQSACVPKEGQIVHFFKDYKIVKCEDIQ